jgi:Zeta toxin
MIWTAERNMDQGALVASMYEQAASVPCERKAVMAGGLRGADTAGALTQAGIDATCYLSISIDAILLDMAGRRLIPHVDGLTPLEAADLVHVEAQFLAKRVGLRALADGRNVIWDITMASRPSVQSWLAAHRSAGYRVDAIFVQISAGESVRRSAAMHRRGHEEYRRGRGDGGRYVPPETIRALASGPAGWSADSVARLLADSLAPGGDMPAVVASGIEVTVMIGSHLAGEMTLGTLCGKFRARSWPAVPPLCRPALEWAASAIDDPEPYVPGS